MKSRIVLFFVLFLCLAVSSGFAQSSDQCKDHASAAKASCCMKGAKATMTSNSEATTGSQAKFVTVSDKDAKTCSMKSCTMKNCTMKGVKNTTGASKGQCTMTASGKGACKDPSKCTAGKAMSKKNTNKTSDPKGTN
jgi:hypothetical protein